MTPEEEAKMREILGGRVTRMPLSLNALQVFAKRYLLKTLDGSVIETPEEMFERVARALADVERRYGASDEQVDAYAREFYDAMFSMRFTPAGRTLANAGGPTRTVSNCIVLHIEDSMEGIMQTLYNAALLQKDGSGLGFPLHLMRPAGAVTRASFGTSSGPVSFLHVYNTAFGVIKQQNRNGANMAVMSVEHPDILEFIYCKKVEGSIRNFNISVGLTDRFMEAVHGDDAAPWYCEFNGERMLPRRIVRDANFSIVSITPVEMTAAQLFAEIVDCAWSNGEPGCVFLDTVNHTNPLPGLGRIESCNPCGEQFLAKNDVCNLGSINLESFVRPTTTSDATDATDATGNDTTMEVDVEALRRVTRTAVRMLDNVIDMSEFSVEDVQRTSRDNRRIGLGIMGFADLLYQLEIGYDTDEGRRTAELVMSTITEAAHQMSQELAAEKGTFANYDKSVYAGRGVPMRNCALTTVAPTGTISMIFDVSGGVEPYFALAYYYKGILGGNVQLQYVNKHLKRALARYGVDTPETIDEIIRRGSLQHIEHLPAKLKEVYVTAMDISPENHVLAQAAFQKHVDNAISKTTNLPFEATQHDVKRVYLTAWKLGLKGLTVYRDGSRQLQVLNLNDTKADAPAADAGEASSAVAEVEAKAKAKAHGKIKTECPTCGGATIVSEGCYLCPGCGTSACSL